MAKRNDPSSQKISNFFHPKKAQKVNNNEDDSVVPQISQVVEPHRVPRVEVELGAGDTLYT